LCYVGYIDTVIIFGLER